MTPYRYVQLRKLLAARRELRQAPQSAKTVSGVAIKYGFTELGRFSVRYRQMFGDLPSETLKTAPGCFPPAHGNRNDTRWKAEQLMYVDLIGYAAGALLAICFLPQVWQTWKTRRADDVIVCG